METALYKAVPFHLWKQSRVPVWSKYCGISVFLKSRTELYPEPWLFSLSVQCSAPSAPVTVWWNIWSSRKELHLRAGSLGWERGSLWSWHRAWRRDGASPQGHCKKIAVPQAGICFAVCCCLTYPCPSHTCQKCGILFKAHQTDGVLKFHIHILPLITLDLDQT